MLGYLIFEAIEFSLGRQGAINQQISYFEEARFFGQLLNGIAAVAENAFFAVEEGDGTFGSASIFVARIEGYVTGLVAQLADVKCFFVFGAFDNGQDNGFAVEDKFSRFCHGREG